MRKEHFERKTAQLSKMWIGNSILDSSEMKSFPLNWSQTLSNQFYLSATQVGRDSREKE
jgi:hypothetical protein